MLFGKHLNKYYLRYLPAFLMGIFALVVVDIMQLYIPEFYRTVVNGIIDGTVKSGDKVVPFDMDYLLDKICFPMLIVIVTIVTGRFLWRLCFLGSAIGMETSLRGEMFDHCKNLSHEFYQVNKVGGLMALFTNDLDTVRECFGWGVLMFFDAFMLGAMAIVKMYLMDPMLTLLSLIPMALLFAIGAVMEHNLKRLWDVRQAAFSDMSDFSQESFSGISVIKAFVKEIVQIFGFRKINERNEVTNVDHTKASMLLSVLTTFFVEAVVCIILGYGGYLVWKGSFDAGQLVEFIGYFTAMVWPVQAVSQLIEKRSRGKASLERISELLDKKPDVCDREGVQEKEINGQIEFRNLTFRHPGAEFDALQNVSFEICNGESVGIVGKTGSGKTTVVELILRIYNVADGALFVGGHDVNSMPIEWLRRHIAYVPQDNFLFSETIGANISFASDDKSEQKMIVSAKMADIHDNIADFKDGYETVLGERGITVSGGQKQRISIARALMKDAEILILDDAVSAVDVKTEKIILQNLKEIRGDKTTIMIAHRISTVENMDKIIFIDDGKIVDVGTHDELCARSADYKSMVELQKLEDERRDVGEVRRA